MLPEIIIMLKTKDNDVFCQKYKDRETKVAIINSRCNRTEQHDTFALKTYKRKLTNITHHESTICRDTISSHPLFWTNP